MKRLTKKRFSLLLSLLQNDSRLELLKEVGEDYKLYVKGSSVYTYEPVLDGYSLSVEYVLVDNYSDLQF